MKRNLGVGTVKPTGKGRLLIGMSASGYIAHLFEAWKGQCFWLRTLALGG